MNNGNDKIVRKPVTLIRKPAKIAPNRYAFTIPPEYIKNDFINPEKTYRLYLEEIEVEEKKEL